MKQKRVSGAGLVLLLLKKDAIAYSRDRLYTILSLAGLVMFIAVFFLMPDSVDESVTVGIHHYDMQELFSDDVLNEEGAQLLMFPDEQSLKRVINNEAEAWRTSDGRLIIRESSESRPSDAQRESLNVGIAFPESFLADTVSGRESTVRLYVNHDTPPEIQNAMKSVIREAAFQITGLPLPITEPDAEEVILGVDRMGAQISMRERMRPMLVFFMLMMETFALSSLIAYEITHKTLTALTATPVKLRHVLTAKTLFGTLLAMTQAVVIMAVIGAFTLGTIFPLLLILFVGSVMFTSIGMVVGSLGKDFLENLFLCMACLIPLMVPSFGALIPGSTAPWVRFVPSYGIMKALMDLTAFGYAWTDAVSSIIPSAVWAAGLLVLALGILNKKAAAL